MDPNGSPFFFTQNHTMSPLHPSQPSFKGAPMSDTMGKATKIMRSSIHIFLQRYHSFTTIATLLVLPVSASILLSQSLLIPSFSSSKAFHTISFRLRLLFDAAGFPSSSSSQLFSLLNLKITQTVMSLIFTLPFTLTFSILSISAIVHTLWIHSPPPFTSILHTYHSVLVTHIFSSFIILSANATIFSLLFLSFNSMEALGLSSHNSTIALSAAGAVLYSIVLANTMMVCNMASIVSAAENCSGYIAVLKACVLISGKMGTALAASLPTNLGMAGVEALFQYRVIRPYLLSGKIQIGMVSEGFVIAYMYSILIVIDVITRCVFFRCCESRREERCDHMQELEPEEKGVLLV